MSPGEYLESALQPVKGAGRSVEAKNAVSRYLAVHTLVKEILQRGNACPKLPIPAGMISSRPRRVLTEEHLLGN